MLQDWASCWVRHGLEKGIPLNEEVSQGWVSGQETDHSWPHLTTGHQVHWPGTQAAGPSLPGTPFPVETVQAVAGQVADLLVPGKPCLAAGLECPAPLAVAAVEASAVVASVDVVAVAASDLSVVFADTQPSVLDPYW